MWVCRWSRSPKYCPHCTHWWTSPSATCSSGCLARLCTSMAHFLAKLAPHFGHWCSFLLACLGWWSLSSAAESNMAPHNLQASPPLCLPLMWRYRLTLWWYARPHNSHRNDPASFLQCICSKGPALYQKETESSHYEEVRNVLNVVKVKFIWRRLLTRDGICCLQCNILPSTKPAQAFKHLTFITTDRLVLLKTTLPLPQCCNNILTQYWNHLHSSSVKSRVLLSDDTACI